MGIAVINIKLRDFQPKEVFIWHCSIMVELNEVNEEGLPSAKELAIIDGFEDRLDSKIKEGEEEEKPNALFLGRITWNGTRELIWRVYNPERTNNYLQKLINNNDHVRPFEYRIDKDDEWELTKWHLKTFLTRTDSCFFIASQSRSMYCINHPFSVWSTTQSPVDNSCK